MSVFGLCEFANLASEQCRTFAHCARMNDSVHLPQQRKNKHVCICTFFPVSRLSLIPGGNFGSQYLYSDMR